MGYLGIDATLVEEDPLTKSRTPDAKYRKVPLLVFQRDPASATQADELDQLAAVAATAAAIVGKQADEVVRRLQPGTLAVRESAVIVQLLLLLARERGQLTEAALQRFNSEEARRWADWADRRFAVLLFPNLTRSLEEARQAFSYVLPPAPAAASFSFLQQQAIYHIGSFAMWAAQGKIKAKYNIADERQALAAAATEWVSDGIAGRLFHGGAAPDLGDLAVYGSLRAIQGTNTQSDALALHPGLREWYDRVHSAVESRRAAALGNQKA